MGFYIKPLTIAAGLTRHTITEASIYNDTGDMLEQKKSALDLRARHYPYAGNS